MIKNNYYAHLIIGLIIGIILSTTFEGVPTFIQYFLTTFVATVSGIAWEWFWKMYNDSEIDYRDVLWGFNWKCFRFNGCKFSLWNFFIIIGWLF